MFQKAYLRNAFCVCKSLFIQLVLFEGLTGKYLDQIS